MKTQAYSEAITILENGLRHEVDKLRFVAAMMYDNTALDDLMPRAPKGSVSNGLRGLVERVAEAYDFAIIALVNKTKEAQESEATK